MIALATLLAAAAAVSVVAGVRSATTGTVLALLPIQGAVAGPKGHRLDRLGRSRIGRRLDTDQAHDALGACGWSVSPERFAGVRVLSGIVGVAVALIGPAPLPLLAPLLGLAGARLPFFVAARAAQRHRRAIDDEVPQLLDLLAAGSSAGLAAPLALRRATDALQGPLGSELRSTLDAVELGGRWRDELHGLATRLQLPDLARTVAVLTRTGALGSSLTDQTIQLAASVRAARRALVTERARKAPVKMLFPLVFLVLPAFLLLTVVPVLLTTLRSIR